ncbi:MAG: phosphatase PAP2 family protein [Prolixibacteraceae bacterium]|nr:phosphatase PAP2 family protein [Prolixibacteraceae bacterium]
MGKLGRHIACFIFSAKLVFLLLTTFGSLQSIAGERKDTLVNREWRDTIRLEKAQIYEVNPEYSLMFYRPKPFQFAKNVPSDLYLLGKTAFSKKNLPKLGAILGGTALLIAVDQPVIDAARQFGRYINLDPARKSKTVIEVDFGSFSVDVLELPQNVNSAMYFLGEGWPSILLAGGFYTYGLASNDYRALQTTSQLAEMFFTLAITTQFLKRITGRESPFRAIKPAGDWHLFPSPAHYQQNVSKHDAFPSGHLATAMATVTILAGNYPEKKYIKPVGYTLMGLLAYSMLNNEVHWISDYPLAIAIGYTCGKIALSRGNQVIPLLSNANGASSTLTPAFFREGGIGLSYRATF